MRSPTPPRRPAVRPAALALLLPVLLGGCLTPATETPLANQVGQTRTSVQAETAAWSLPFAERGARETWLTFIAEDYRRRGQGPVVVLAADGDEARALADGLEARLGEAGLTPRIEPRLGDPGPALVSYQALSVRLPRCTGGADPSPQDVDGCSIERQVGLMVSRPADLLGRGGAAPGDSQREALNTGRQVVTDTDQADPGIFDDVGISTTEGL